MSPTAKTTALATAPAVQLEGLANVAYVYDGSTEGLLAAIFQAYANHEHPSDIVHEGVLQPRLGQSIRIIETSPELAERVRKGIVKRANRSAWETILRASLSDKPDAGTAVYQLVRLIMARPAAQNQAITNDFAHPVAGPVLALCRAVNNEEHHMRQFLRFEHCKGNVWFAKCNPNANVVPLLMGYFAGRFNTQRFVIYDEVHHLAGIYDGRTWGLAEVASAPQPGALQQTAEEQAMQDAWKSFYASVAIAARYHPELRTQFMPKRFWKNILEVRDEAPAPHAALHAGVSAAALDTTLPLLRTQPGLPNKTGSG